MVRMPRDNLISILGELGEYEVRKKIAEGKFFFQSEAPYVKEWLEQQAALRVLAEPEELNRMKVFVSHVTEESPLALVVKDWIESSFAGQCDVFVSSDKDDIPAGTKWLEEIDRALGEAAVLIVLCSPASLSRPWINFEMGCGWIKRVPLIPICHSDQKKGALPPPISNFQALELDDQNFVSDLLSSLAKHLGFQKVPRIDESRMKKALLAAATQSEKQHVAPEREKDSETLNVPLESDAIKILTFLGKLGDEHPTAGKLAAQFKMSEQRMRYFLDILCEVKFVYPLYGAVTNYTLAPLGRKYLFEKGLL